MPDQDKHPKTGGLSPGILQVYFKKCGLLRRSMRCGRLNTIIIAGWEKGGRFGGVESMSRKNRILAILITAFLFTDAAVLPMLLGGKFNATFFALAMVFLVIGLGMAKKKIGS